MAAGGAGDAADLRQGVRQHASAAHVQALARTTLLRGLDASALEDLAAQAGVRSYDAGELLLEQGERGGSVLVLLSGAVTVYRCGAGGRRAALAHLRPPAVLGEVTLLDASPRSASVEAVEPTLALELAREDLLRCLQRNAALLDGVLSALGNLIRRLSDRAADPFLLDLSGRVAKTLVVLAGAGPGPHLVRLSQARLAELVGGSRQSVNEVLSAFGQRGVLHVEGRQIVVDDPDALRRRAGLPPSPEGRRR